MSRWDSAEYPAFVWCRAKGKDWYLPARDELKLLLLDSSVHEAVNRTLKERGGVRLIDKGKFGWYWSSTEYESDKDICAWLVDMSLGLTNLLNKHSLNYVRAVSAF